MHQLQWLRNMSPYKANYNEQHHILHDLDWVCTPHPHDKMVAYSLPYTDRIRETQMSFIGMQK
jgi:hypothetical protein